MKKEKKERKKECKPLIFPIAKSVSIKASVKIAFYVFFSFPIKGINLSLFSTPVPHMPTFFPPQRTLFKTIIFRCFFFFFSDSCSLHQHHPRLSTSFSNIFFSSSPQSTFEHRAVPLNGIMFLRTQPLGEEARRRVLLLPFVRGKALYTCR